MNKQEFLNRLEAQLMRIPHEEAREALVYYREYFDEAGEENEQAVIEELGSPERIVTQLRANIAMKNLKRQEMPSVKKGVSAIWLVVLAIFAAPIALPLAFAALVLVLALSITAIAIVISLVIAVVAFFLSGIFTIGVGLFTITNNIGAAMCAIGGGLVIMGITLLLAMLVIFVARGMSRFIAMLTNKILKKADNGGQHNV